MPVFYASREEIDKAGFREWLKQCGDNAVGYKCEPMKFAITNFLREICRGQNAYIRDRHVVVFMGYSDSGMGLERQFDIAPWTTVFLNHFNRGRHPLDEPRSISGLEALRILDGVDSILSGN